MKNNTNDKPYAIRDDQLTQMRELIIDAMETAKETNQSFMLGFETPLSQNGVPLRLNGSNWVPYKGFNVIWLTMFAYANGYTSNQFATKKGWKRLGGTIEKDQKATISHWSKPMTVTDKDDNGEETKKSFFINKCFYVYNRDQVQGLPEQEKKPIENRPTFNNDRLDRFTMAQGIETINGDTGAFYRPGTDSIHMPLKNHFKGTKTLTPEECYYSTLLHEHIHATGHAKRLNRKGITSKQRSKQIYAKEELVAEIGATLLCCDLNVHSIGKLQDHATYLNEWIDAIKNDNKNKLLFSVFSLATNAVEYMHEQNMIKNKIKKTA